MHISVSSSYQYIINAVCKRHCSHIYPCHTQFYQRNGRAYAISTRDSLLIEIMHGVTQIPPVVELGGGRQSESNTAGVVFTVRRSGDYRIAVMIGANHIRGSPFLKKFLPGDSFVCACVAVLVLQWNLALRSPLLSPKLYPLCKE